MADRLDQLGARIEIAIDPMTKAHQPEGIVFVLGLGDILIDLGDIADLDAIQPGRTEIPLFDNAGNSIGTDRRFLARHLPEIEDHLHYRSVDVSTIKELAKRWSPSLLKDAPVKVGSHRALDDIRESIEELRYYREHLFLPEIAKPAARA